MIEGLGEFLVFSFGFLVIGGMGRLEDVISGGGDAVVCIIGCHGKIESPN